MIHKLLKQLPLILMGIFILLAIILVNLGFGRLDQVYFFPLDNGSGYNGEERQIRRYSDKAERMEHTVKELLLGPSELELENIVPQGTKLQSLILRDKKVYLDFSRHFFEDFKGYSLPFQERLEYVEKNMIFNYPFLEEVVITIEGQLPLSPYYRIEQDFNNDNS